jgi:hypothetical protein
VETPASIGALAASAPFTRLRVAASMEWGGRVFWEDAEAQPFGEGLPDPHVAFTRGGMLVALTPEEGRVYRTNEGRVVHHSTFPGPKAPLLAVVPTAKVNEFAAFTAAGVVRVYQVPG